MTDRINEMTKGFGTFVAEIMPKWNLPGMAVAVVKDGEVILAEGYGTRKAGEDSPMTPDTLLAIGSCSKAFTALSVAMLVDEGKLNWDTPVRDYMPEFKLYDPIASARMTPRDLLCHRSGLPRYDLMWYNASASRQELMARLQYLEPTHDFRAIWQYQNLMYLAAGCLIEKITDMSWEAFVQERILKPLGMENTNFSVDDSQKNTDFSYPHDKKEDEVRIIPFRDISTVGPAGSINSSVRDMAKWVALHLDNGKLGEVELVSVAGIGEVVTPQMILPPQPKEMAECEFPNIPSSVYGLGWGIQVYRDRKMAWHTGGIDGFTAMVSFMPQENMGMVVLTNANASPVPNIATYALYDLLLGLEPLEWNESYVKFNEKMKEVQRKGKEERAKNRIADTSPTHLLEAYAGIYEHPGYGQLVVGFEDGQLAVTYNDIGYELTHYHYNVFESYNAFTEATMLISFEVNKKGKVSKVKIPLEPSIEDIVFGKKEEQLIT